MSHTVETPEVLSLDEAAEYLRLPNETVENLVGVEGLPGRRINGQWRFLKAAINDWLSLRSGKAVMLSQAGALAADETLRDVLTAIYKERGRSEVNGD